MLGIYLATAAADAAGKALAASPAVNEALRRHVEGAAKEELREAARPSGNFEIFRTASRHLVEGIDLYAEYPREHVDRFKYSPTFALLFAPFAWLPWPLALFLWSSLNALLLFVAVERVLPARAALFAMALLHLEVLRGMQNAQSNALVAGLIIFTFAAVEWRSAWRAALAVGLGACVKIFPLAALTFAIPRRLAVRAALCAAAVGAALVVLPLAVTSPTLLLAQYRSWFGIESIDATQRWFSLMELIHRVTALDLPNWPIQLAATLILLAPLALRRDRWDESGFRLLYLCSLLIYVVLFNHQAERASYVIAFTGATIWFVGVPRTRLTSLWYGIALVSMPIITTLVPGAMFRTPMVTLLRLTVPCLAIWIAIQLQLHRRVQDDSVAVRSS